MVRREALLGENTNNPEKFKYVRIQGVPIITQKHGDWCGYASTATQLQYWWGRDYTDVSVYEQLHGTYDPEIERKKPKLSPTPGALIKISRELITPKPKIHHVYGDYCKTKGIKPTDLLETFLRAGIPVTVRIPGHYLVAIGFDADDYTFVNSNKFTEHYMNRKEFEYEWSKPEASKDWEARYFMLAIYPADRELVLQKRKRNLITVTS